MHVQEGWGQYRIAELEGGSVIGLRVVAVAYNYGESRACTMFSGDILLYLPLIMFPSTAVFKERVVQQLQ